MTVSLSMLAGAGAQFFDNNGVPLAGGLLYTYLAGSVTPATTYQTSAGSGGASNSNPITLDSAGRVPYQIWLTDGVSYKFVLKTSSDATIRTEDAVYGGANISPFLTSSGSSLIGFIQSGTGAVATTVQSKLRVEVDAKLDFGAVGDGVTNDTTALQNAVTAAEGKQLNIPLGTYIIYSDLEIPNDIRIVGASKTGTIIKLVPKTTQAVLSNNIFINGKDSVIIENLTVDNSAVDDPYVAQTHGGHCIQVEGSSNIVVRNVLLKKALFKAITFGGCTDCYYLESTSMNCGYDGWHAWGSQRMWCENNYFYDCENIEASGYLEGAYTEICDDIHFRGNVVVDMRAGAVHFWGVRRGWFESNKVIYTTRTSTSSKVAFRTTKGGITGRECGTIFSRGNVAINAYRGFQYTEASYIIEEGNIQQSAYDIGFLYGAVTGHIQTDNCFSFESRNDAYRVDTTDNAVVVNFGNSAKGPASDIVTNSACLSVRSGTVIQKNCSLVTGAYTRNTWLVSTFTGTFVEGKNANTASPTVDATSATVVLQNEFSDYYVQIGSSTDTGQELRFNPNGYIKYYQTGGNAGKFEINPETGGTKDVSLINTGGDVRLSIDGKTILMKRTDGTQVALTVDNTNTLIIT